MESNSICNHTVPVIKKIGWLLSESPICQSLVWLQTEFDNKKSCYQLIIAITISKDNKYILVKYLW